MLSSTKSRLSAAKAGFAGKNLLLKLFLLATTIIFISSESVSQPLQKGTTETFKVYSNNVKKINHMAPTADKLFRKRAPSEAPPPNGLVAYYPFTGNTSDSSGNGHHGAPINNPLLVNDRFGNSASAYVFDGINQRIDLPSSIKITADLSISFWIQTAVVDNETWPVARFIIDRDICGWARDWSVGLGLGGKIQFETGTSNSNQVLTSTIDVNDSIWHHIVVIRDSAGQSKKIYIDGLLNISTGFDGGQFLNNNYNIYIAATTCDPTLHKYFPGTVDDICIYKRPLSEQEVQQLFHEKENLVAYYPFTGNANDYSGNGHHGAPINNPLLVNDRFGNVASAYYLDGINQQINLPPSIKITADLSISFWIQTAVVDNETWPAARFIIDRDICGWARDWSVGLGLGGKIQFETGTSNSNQVLTSTIDVNDSIWHHIVVIRDSAGQSKKIYIDGLLNISTGFDGGQFLNNNYNIYIAATTCDPTLHKYFPGAIDDIRFYKRPLTEEEIQQLFFESGWIPVELTSFTASVNKNNVTLNWSTATELNNKGFEIERASLSASPGQEDWEKIGFVPGAGTTTEPRSYSFIDNDITPGKYSYRLKQIDYDGTFEYSEGVEVEIDLLAPVEYALEQNYPNPFNPVTTIKFSVPEATNVTLAVYNTLGERVTELINAKLETGRYSYEWDARDFASGVYIYELRTDKFVSVKKMVLLK